MLKWLAPSLKHNDASHTFSMSDTFPLFGVDVLVEFGIVDDGVVGNSFKIVRNHLYKEIVDVPSMRLELVYLPRHLTYIGAESVFDF